MVPYSFIGSLSLTFFMLVLCLQAPSCTGSSPNGMEDVLQGRLYSVDELQADFMQFRQFLEESHPQLYRYTSKGTYDSLFNYHYQRIDHSMTTLEFYELLIPLVARVGCGHTSLWAPDGYWDKAPQRMYPLWVYTHGGELFSIHSYGQDSPISPGRKILSINGVAADSIVMKIVNNIWSDGFIMSKRIQRFNAVFPYLYALNYGFPEHFMIEFLESGNVKQVNMNPVSRIHVDASIDSIYTPGGARYPGLGLELVDEKSAILRIGSFAYYDNTEGFNSFIDSSFMVIRDHHIKHLIIDLRGNDGGDPFCSSHLFTYLQREPVVYFRERYGQYARLNQPLPMAEHPYKGNQYYLIDGVCFSTTGHFTSLLKYHNLGIFIGEEAGATYTCNDASHDVRLKYTAYRLQSARRSFTAAAYGFPMDQGILPDHYVQQTIEEAIRGCDAVLEYTLKLISALPE